MQNLTPRELSERLQDAMQRAPILLDVREPWEFERCKIDGSILIPMNTVAARLNELDPQQEIVCICHHGGRSMQIAMFLNKRGFERIFNLTGGVHAWAQQVDSSMPTY